MFNMFSGGALARLSLFALNVMPYISASIIIQLCAQIFPSLQALRKEGESGRRKLTQWTRYFTVLLAMGQAAGVALALQSQRSEEHTSELQSPMRISSAVFSLQNTTYIQIHNTLHLTPTSSSPTSSLAP